MTNKQKSTFFVVKIIIIVICSVGIIAGLNYFSLASPDPKNRFTEDVKMDISGSGADIFALSGAECDDLNFFGSYLTSDISAGSDFKIGNSPSNYLSVNPTSGQAKLILSGADMDSAGYVYSWQLSGNPSSSVHLDLKTLKDNTYYDVKINSATYTSLDSGANGRIAFDYNNLTATSVFEIVEADRVVSGGIPLWFLELVSRQSKQAASEENAILNPTPSTENDLNPITILESKDEKKIENLISQEAYNFIESNKTPEPLVKLNLKSALNALMVKIKNIFGTDQTIERFVRVGTPATYRLGEGERAGLLASYKDNFRHNPKTKSDWEDVFRLANGLPPIAKNKISEKLADSQFLQIFKRNKLENNKNDLRAFNMIAYGMRPFARSLIKEKKAINNFVKNFLKKPFANKDWNIMRAMAYH
jgi:hypothetical protein